MKDSETGYVSDWDLLVVVENEETSKRSCAVG